MRSKERATKLVALATSIGTAVVLAAAGDYATAIGVFAAALSSVSGLTPNEPGWPPKRKEQP